jgi:hypothetical protein
MYTMTAFAENQNEANSKVVQIVPLVQYENLSLTAQSVQSLSAGLLINGTDYQFTGLYTQHVFEEPLQYGFPRLYHTIDTLLDKRQGRNQYIGIFQSESDLPVSGGINTFQAGALYGYEMIHRPKLSLVLGGGIAVGNFGLKTPGGKNVPVIPVPLVRMNYYSDWLYANFEFITAPNLSFILAPRGHMRLTGDLRMGQLRDRRDFIFELALAYRPYSDQDEHGDFFGLSIGITNNNYGAFKLGDKGEEESIEVHYRSLFAAVDVSVLKISAGYAFDGRLLYRETQEEDLGEGYFISVQAMYPF